MQYPIDYPVPNLGIDHNIQATFTSLKDAEKITGKTWNFEFRDKDLGPINPAARTLYNFDPELSHDVIASEESLKSTEEALRKKFDVPEPESPTIIKS